ncbi:MAG: DoxX family membrane protein, partial [Chloroflexota bacterium]|nr:DoxX family membrane protein [Chloroflexota bacterium]
MDSALVVARLLLATVFVVAGLAKLRDRPGSRQALIDFGIPPALAAPLGLLLPLAELAVAVALVPVASAWWGALGALALLLLFVAGIVFNLARGRTPDCHCFGQLHSAPAGPATLIRNVLLAAVASFVVWQGQAGPSALQWLDALAQAGGVGLGAAALGLGLFVAQGWFLVQLLQQNGRLLLRLEALETALAAVGIVPTPRADGTAEGLPINAAAPAFRLADLDGEMLTLDALRAAGTPILLVFSDPNCGPCNALLPEIGRWQRDYADKLRITLISSG